MTTKSLVLSQDLVSAAIRKAELADSTRAQYQKAVNHYLATGASLSDAQALAEYAQGLKRSSKAFLKAGVRLVVAEIEHRLKSGVDPESLPQVQAGLLRLDAIKSAIKVKYVEGVKAHLWLDRMEVRDLMRTCGDDLTGLRDWVVLALLVGAGLRRSELVDLTFADVIEQPVNGRKRTVLQVKGKGAKDRVVPISDVLATRLQEWKALVGDGRIARSLGRSKQIGESISVIGAFEIVRKHGAAIGQDTLAPHDLRRTYAQLGYEAGVPITQISRLLGHATLATTQKYLNLELDLESTISDFIPL